MPPPDPRSDNPCPPVVAQFCIRERAEHRGLGEGTEHVGVGVDTHVCGMACPGQPLEHARASFSSAVPPSGTSGECSPSSAVDGLMAVTAAACRSLEDGLRSRVMDTDPIADHVVALTNELDELAEQMQTLVEELVQDEAAGAVVRASMTRDVAQRAERILRIAYYSAGMGAGAARQPTRAGDGPA